MGWRQALSHEKTQCLGTHFYAWLNTYFLSSWRLFFQKKSKIWNFWKVAINFCDSVNPLWVSSRSFSRSIYHKTTCCGVAALVLSDSAAYMTGYVALTATPKNKNKISKNAGTETGVHDGPALPAMFCDVICRRLLLQVEFALHYVLHRRTQRTKEIRHV